MGGRRHLLFALISFTLTLSQADYWDNSYPHDYSEDEIPSSECGQDLFVSTESKSGTFQSPYYPNDYPENINCNYVFKGIGKERVQIVFKDLDLYTDGHRTGGPNGQHCNDEDSVLVKAVIDGGKKDVGRYCGNMKTHKLMSSGNEMEVKFTTHSREPSTAKGFKATYNFVTDFGIKGGVQDESKGCVFNFISKEAPNGTFTSPNFPGLYPKNTDCEYVFTGEDHEIVEITFPVFDVEGVPPNCDGASKSDFVEFSNFRIPDRKMGRFCGIKEENIKKSVKSDAAFFRVIFKSNDQYDAQGFEGFYQFRSQEDPYTGRMKDSKDVDSSSDSSLIRGSIVCTLVVTLLILLPL